MNECRLKERPNFTTNEIANERRQLTRIDDALCKHGQLQIVKLYDTIKEENDYFKDVNALCEFIRKRSNVFEMSFNYVSNRCVEYRMMFGYLVNFLINMENPNERTIAQREVDCKSFEKTSLFLRRHPNFFFIRLTNEGNFVELLESGGTIASAWECDALPQHPNGTRYDRSIQMCATGQVIKTIPGRDTIVIRIDKGAYAGQVVRASRQHIPNCHSNLAIKYPCGRSVNVCAFRVYGDDHLWSACQLEDADECYSKIANIWCYSKPCDH
ncbi:unnamed protein product [Anisakis simplex]|uniref:MIR domain-containing protein n=1 Tax=Anisakis simplex TaxID=6269 RepID=A0A0M3K8D2_ANISI|nr:unnamed protein product [Anisakis simplex]